MNPSPPAIAIRLRPFQIRDAEILADISRRAFESDVEHGAPTLRGPPGYASPDWQVKTAQKAKAYLVIEADGAVAGGIIVFESKKEYWLGRMYVDPTLHQRGIGSEALRQLEAEYPDAVRWLLETPPWNRRTQRFYERSGYVRIGNAYSGDYLYEKRPD